MMKIAGPVEKKRRKIAADLAIKIFDQLRRRGETELRAPGGRVFGLERKRRDWPGVIQVEMKRVAQDSNLAVGYRKAKAQIPMRASRRASAMHQ